MVHVNIFESLWNSTYCLVRRTWPDHIIPPHYPIIDPWALALDLNTETRRTKLKANINEVKDPSQSGHHSLCPFIPVNIENEGKFLYVSSLVSIDGVTKLHFIQPTYRTNLFSLFSLKLKTQVLRQNHHLYFHMEAKVPGTTTWGPPTTCLLKGYSSSE